MPSSLFLNPRIIQQSLPTTAVQASVSLRIGGTLTSFNMRSEEHTSELQSRGHLVCRLLLEKKKEEKKKKEKKRKKKKKK